MASIDRTAAWKDWARREWALLAVVFAALLYVLPAWTPSHYGEAARVLGLPGVHPILGHSRAIRSDEWAVSTPYYQIAVANDLGPRNEYSPYREPLKAFFALPSRDWSMAFKPDLWGFLALDPAHAFSLHYAALAAAMLVGFALLLRQLGCTPGFALAVSGLLFLSQFTQVWWANSAAVLGLSPWPAVAYLWRAPWWARTPAIAYAVACWLIGQLYPPIIVGAGLAFAVLILAFRRDALNPGRLLAGLAGGAVGAGVAWLHYADLVPVMSATVYPGRRISSGGGVPLLQLVTHVFPNFVTRRFEPWPDWPTNACEIGVVGTFLPFATLVFADHAALRRWLAARRGAVAIWLGGIVLLGAWMFVPIPGRYAPVLNLVPANRMLWGFGLLFLLGTGVIAGSVPWVLNWRRAAVFVAIVTGGWALSKLVLAPTPEPFRQFDLLAAAWLVLALAGRSLAPGRWNPRAAVMFALAAAAALGFGRFNPVQSAKPIFDPPASAIVDTFRAYAAANPHRWVVTPGMYGAVLNGAGAPAVNHTLLRPELVKLRTAFPELDATSADLVFNRYEHLQPVAQWRPELVQDDLLSLPADRFATPLRVTETPPAAGGATGAVEHVSAVPLGGRRWGVTAEGWGPWTRFDAAQQLGVRLRPEVGRIVQASAYRLPRPDMAARGAQTAAAAGFGARVEVELADDRTRFPAEALSFVAVDPDLGAAALAAAPG